MRLGPLLAHERSPEGGGPTRVSNRADTLLLARNSTVATGSLCSSSHQWIAVTRSRWKPAPTPCPLGTSTPATLRSTRNIAPHNCGCKRERNTFSDGSIPAVYSRSADPSSVEIGTAIGRLNLE